jgi:hypothetical protein
MTVGAVTIGAGHHLIHLLAPPSQMADYARCSGLIGGRRSQATKL